MENEDDFNTVYSKNFKHFEGDDTTKILKWTTKFKLDIETTLDPVWINLPDLPWHFYEWDAL